MQLSAQQPLNRPPERLLKARRIDQAIATSPWRKTHPLQFEDTAYAAAAWQQQDFASDREAFSTVFLHFAGQAAAEAYSIASDDTDDAAAANATVQAAAEAFSIDDADDAAADATGQAAAEAFSIDDADDAAADATGQAAAKAYSTASDSDATDYAPAEALIQQQMQGTGPCSSTAAQNLAAAQSMEAARDCSTHEEEYRRRRKQRQAAESLEEAVSLEEARQIYEASLLDFKVRLLIARLEHT